MRTADLNIKGIVRNTPDHKDNNGGCQEIINMRFQDNTWISVGDKTDTGKKISGYSSFYKHLSTGSEKVIAQNDTSHDIVAVTSATPPAIPSEQVLVDYSDEAFTLYDYAAINDFLIISTSIGRYIYKWNGASYTKIYNSLRTPYLSAYTEVDGAYTSALGSDFESAKINLLSAIAQKRLDNKLFGWIAFRMAYKLYDGNYICYSEIRPHEIMNVDQTTDTFSYATVPIVGFYKIPGGGVDLQLYLSTSIKSALSSYDGLIQSLVIFATDIVDYFDLSAEDEADWGSSTPYDVPTNDNYTNQIMNQTAFYKVYEIPFETLNSLSGSTFDIIDLDLSFIDSIETRESLPLWENPHHIGSKTSFLYNKRLHLGNVYNYLYDGIDLSYYQHNSDDVLGLPNKNLYAGANKYYIAFYLNTEQGEKIVIKRLYPFEYYDTGDHYILVNSVLIYPDTRCYKALIYMDDGSIRKYSNAYDMTPHAIYNFSYHINTSSFNAIGIIVNFAYTIVGEPSEDNILNFPNQFRVSELNNPLKYPASLVYTLEDNSCNVVGFGTMSEPLSEGQWGEYPLYIFTERGIYSAQLGNNEILYSNIKNINKEVCNNADSIVCIGGMIIFATEHGLRILTGRTIKEISTPIEGKISNPLLSSSILTVIENSDKILATSLISTDDFLTYLEGSIVGYYKLNYNGTELKEIIVSNTDYEYSYVYSLDYNAWHKIDKVFQYFYYLLPDVYGFDENDKIYQVNEETSAYKEILIYTRPFSLNSPGLKRIEELMIESYLSKEEDSVAQLYIYASNNLVDWAATGNISINKVTQFNLLLKQTYFSAKYFIILLSGKLKDSTVNKIIMTINDKYNNKLR